MICLGLSSLDSHLLQRLIDPLVSSSRQTALAIFFHCVKLLSPWIFCSRALDENRVHLTDWLPLNRRSISLFPSTYYSIGSTPLDEMEYCLACVLWCCLWSPFIHGLRKASSEQLDYIQPLHNSEDWVVFFWVEWCNEWRLFEYSVSVCLWFGWLVRSSISQSRYESS